MTVSPATYRRTTAAMLLLSAVFVVLGGVVMSLFADRPRPMQGNWKDPAEYGLWVALMLTGSTLGMLVARRQPSNRIGWLFATGGFIGSLAALGDRWSVYALIASPGESGGVAGVFLSFTGLYTAWGLLAVFVPLLFPDGRLRSRRWRPVAWAGAASVIMWSSEIVRRDIFGPERHDFPGVANPLGIAGSTAILDLINVIGLFGLFGCTFVALGSLVARFIGSEGEQRQQLKVIAYGMVMAVVVLFVTANVNSALRGTPFSPVNRALSTLAWLTIPGSFGVAILRYRLYSIDVIISKTLVYGGLAAFISSVYIAVVVGVGSMLGAQDQPNLVLSIVATTLVAITFQPARERLQRFANRLVYGERATPYEVMAGFSRRVADVLSIDEVLPRMAEAAARGVGATASRVDVLLHNGNTRQTTWPPAASAASFDWEMPVTHQGETVGRISIARPVGERLRPHEDQLLSDLVAQAGIALRNVQLAAELQSKLDQISEQAEALRESRQRIVEAQDVERRKIERDLHDGAQQRLVALALTLRMASRRIDATNDERLGELLTEASEELARAHAELRDFARGIHPAILTDAGLQVALESLAERMPLPVRVTVTPERFSNPIESTAYFVVSEALANVAKHARANTAAVAINRSGSRLHIEVADDGCGAVDASAGSGLRGLADRVAAIDGTLRIDSPPGRGTNLVVELPCE